MALFGPTAVGKSTLAHAAAQALGGEVVVADPFQRYRGLEITADSPRARERREVTYHLVGDLELHERSTAGEFAPRAHAAIDDILARGRVPIVSGGTGLYLRAALANLDFAGPPSAEVRRWADEHVALGTDAAADKLRELDPEAVEAVDIRNPRRLARALERAVTGSSIASGQLWDTTTRLPSALVALVRPRPVLDRLIADRVQRELHDGLVDELRAALGHRDVAREPLQIIGAREVAALDAGDLDAGDLPDRLAARTRRLARRQLAWLRRTQGADLLDLAEKPPAGAVSALLKRWERASRA